MLFKKHHPKLMFFLSIVALLVAIFAIQKKIVADLATNLNWCAANVGSIGIPLSECQSLAHLYNETSGDNRTDHTNWFVSTNLSTWAPLNAITINGGHIVRLHINTNNLTGTITQGLDGLIWLTGLSLPVNHLRGLDISNNLLLEEMSLSTNKINYLDMSNNTLLKRVFITANLLTGLDISNNTNLTLLSASANQLTGLNFTNNLMLADLHLAINNITGYFDTSILPQLRLLNISNNHLTGINVMQNPLLEELYLYQNDLISIDVTNNPQLERLMFMNNYLTGIDISQNTGLRSLLADYNSLTGLDISQHTGLTELSFRGNGIRTLDVANAGDYPAGTYHFFSGNNLCYIDTTNPVGLNLVTFLTQFESDWQDVQFCSPKDLTATVDTNNGNVTLDWFPPDGYFDISSPQTYYMLSINGGANIQLPPTDITHLITGLGSNMQHTFKLCAYPSDAIGEWPDATGICEVVTAFINDNVVIPDDDDDVGFGGGYVPDNCPDGDFSGRPSDGECGDEVEEPVDPVEDPMLPAPSNPFNPHLIPSGSLNCPSVDSEYNDAFDFAFQYEITTMPTCMKANMGGKLLRKDAAKMMVNFIKHTTGRQPDRRITCRFTDMFGADAESQKFAIEACQLGIMGLKGDGTPDSKFYPLRYIDKKQFTTMISRMLYGDTYNTPTNAAGQCWYCSHVNALYNAGILRTTGGLDVQFNRGFAFIMLMRAVRSQQ